MTRYERPQTIANALALLGEGRWRMVAGGTDFYPAQGSTPIREDMLDLTGLAELRAIFETETHYILGAGATWTEVARATLPPAFRALQQAAIEVGSVQIQNVGTIAGNLCNASPAADGVPALMVLDAEVELQSLGGTRHLPLAVFLEGVRRTALRPNEMMTAIRVPKAAAGGASAFVKLGARRYLVISIAMAAARVVLDEEGRIAAAAVAVGACSAVAQRLSGLEAALRGLRPAQVRDALRPEHFAGLTPIEDVRGSVKYREEAAGEIVARALFAATRKPLREAIAA